MSPANLAHLEKWVLQEINAGNKAVVIDPTIIFQLISDLKTTVNYTRSLKGELHEEKAAKSWGATRWGL